MSKKTTLIFAPSDPKIIEATFSFPELVPSMQKISSFYLFTLEIQSILESHAKLFNQAYGKNFDRLLSVENFYQQ